MALAIKFQGMLRDCMVKGLSEEFPEMNAFFPGTLNINLVEPPDWPPPRDSELRLAAHHQGHRSTLLRNGNYLHPQLRIVSINGLLVDGRVYYPSCDRVGQR